MTDFPFALQPLMALVKPLGKSSTADDRAAHQVDYEAKAPTLLAQLNAAELPSLVARQTAYAEYCVSLGWECAASNLRAAQEALRLLTDYAGSAVATACVEKPVFVAKGPVKATAVKADTPADVKSAVKKFGYELKKGFGHVATSFVRTDMFGSAKPGRALFRVLGMRNVSVERNDVPLGDDALHVLIHLGSRVTDWHPTLGQTVAFNPWRLIESMGWSVNTNSLERLKAALGEMLRTTVRVKHKDGLGTTEAAALISRVRTDYAKAEACEWDATLPSTLLNLLNTFKTFVHLETLAILPATAQRLYLFFKSEASRESEWDTDDLADLCGLTGNKSAEKMREALKVLVAGQVVKKARGLAAGKAPTAHEFLPTLDSFKFCRVDGVLRVAVVKTDTTSATVDTDTLEG